MAWLDRLDDPAIYEYAYLTIEGTPYLFTSQELPTAMVPVGYEQIVCLDLTGGIEIPQSPLERKSGVASPQPFAIKLGPRNAERLLQVCAPRGASFRSKLTADFDYNDTKLYCATAGGPTAGEFVYIGREACEVQSVNAAYFELTSAANREQLDSVQWSFRGDATKYVTNQPEIFEGRLARLWVGLCDDAGAPLDAALYGDNQVEVYVGRIEGLSPADDWYSWDMKLNGLESMLDVQIGGYPIEGYLDAYGLSQGADGYVNGQQAYASGYINAGRNKVFIYADDLTNQADVEVTLDEGYHEDLVNHVAQKIATTMNNPPYTWVGTWICIPDAISGVDATFPNSDGDDPDWLDKFTHRLKMRYNTTGVGTVSSELMYFKTGPGDFLPTLGFVAADYEVKGQNDGALDRYWRHEATELPAAAYVGVSDTSIQVYTPEAEDWPSEGFIRLGDDDESEIAHFDSKTAKFTNHTYVLTLDKRGALGTTPREIKLPYEFAASADGKKLAWVRASGTIRLNSFSGLTNENIIDIILKVLASTGTAGVRDATYDVAAVFKNFGASLRLDTFDVDRFEQLSSLLPKELTEQRYLTWQKSQNLNSWLSDELSFLGLTLQGRRLPSGRFKLTLDQVSDPNIVNQATLTDADIVSAMGIKQQRVSKGIVNQMIAKTLWNPAREEFEAFQWEINDQDSQELYGIKPPIEIRARGMMFSVAAGKTTAEQQILSVMSHYSRPYELVTFSVSRSGWRYQPGDQIALTHAGIPNDDGTRGWTDEPLIVLAASPNYIGRGSKAPTRLTCLRLGDRKLSYYVPSAKVTNYVDGTLTLTLAANEYSSAAVPFPLDSSVNCKDIRWFDLVGSDILIAVEGDTTNRDKRTVDSVDIDTNEIVINSSLSLGNQVEIALGARAVIYYPSFDDCDATQKLYIHLADTNAELGAANVDAFQYSG